MKENPHPERWERNLKNNSSDDEAPVAGWQTIYCSLALILVAFFAMLVSYSSIETKKVKIFMEKYGITESESTFSGSAGVIPSRRDIDDADEDVETAVKPLDRYFKNAGLGESVYISKLKSGFKVVVESHVMFPSGFATIEKEAYPSLDEIVKAAREGNFFVRVEGHTDNAPIHTPQFPSNWELSTVRAVNVLRYLADKGKLTAKRLSAVGFGEYHPVESNDTPEGRRKNRRVEFYFEPKKEYKK